MKVFLPFLLLSSITTWVNGFLPTPSLSTNPRRTINTSLRCSHSIIIEYCTGCRWMLKSFWMAQELLTTFSDGEIDAITIMPSSMKGIFQVRYEEVDDDLVVIDAMIWDRAMEKGFPQLKELKQLVRDHVKPDKYLGHSDATERQQDGSRTVEANEEDNTHRSDARTQMAARDRSLPEAPRPSVSIYYCTGCRWLLRAAYMGQELLTTFSDVNELRSVTLVPSPEEGGRFVSSCQQKLPFFRFLLLPSGTMITISLLSLVY